MCIIYRMMNYCLCWLFLVTVDIIRDWLPPVTELPFVRVMNWVAVLHQVLCFHNHAAKTIIWGHFYGFKSKHLFRMNLMHGTTDNISQIPILTWPGMTSSLTSHGSVNGTTQNFSLNSFLVLSFDTKMYHLKRRLKVLRANKCYENLPFISIDVSFRKTISLITFP